VRPTRVLLAKPGLDGHDRGIKVVAMALRDAGAEVIYLGLRRTPEEIWRAAVDEDADVVGVSVLSGAHVALAEELLAERMRVGADVPLVVGGTVSLEDARSLGAMGVDAVHPVGANLSQVVESVLTLGAGERTA
jgi:methylmalonyl-CoA mutase C-terminal domain/subunit